MAALNELTTPIDRVSKLLFREYADLLLHLIFPGEPIRIVNIEENVEINLPTRPVDMVMTISSGTGDQERQVALHIEYYAHHEADIAQTLFIYSAELTDRMKMPVATIVIYSEPRRSELRPRPEYNVLVGDAVINSFTYRDLWLVDYATQIENGELAPLAPFLVEFKAKPTIETVTLAQKLARSEPNEERRGLLLSLVVLLAARYFDKETLRRLFRQEEKMMRTNTFIDEWLDEATEKGLREGEKKGREVGRLEAEYDLLLHLLRHRFGFVSDKLLAMLVNLSTEQLRTLFDLALDAENLDMFEGSVRALKKHSNES